MFEIIEYKSNAHPDTICDIVCDDLTNTLDYYYKTKYGHIKHYNIDKSLLCAGDINIYFGGGEIIKEPEFILGGQISFLDDELKNILNERINKKIKELVPNLPNINILIKSNNVSYSLNKISENEIILANDTSFGVGYYPYSKNENFVFEISEKIKDLIKVLPIGELYKIMLTPNSITICSPIYSKFCKNKNEYDLIKKDFINKLNIGNVLFNTSDIPFLTLCGSSIENGDDGQVGRGNRYNGLITPNRPMTIEAFHGKNNRNHVGKLYQKLAFEKAKEIYEKTNEYTEVFIVSKIGKPIDEYEIFINNERTKNL